MAWLSLRLWYSCLIEDCVQRALGEFAVPVMGHGGRAACFRVEPADMAVPLPPCPRTNPYLARYSSTSLALSGFMRIPVHEPRDVPSPFRG